MDILVEENITPVLIVQDKPVFRSIINSIYLNITGFENNDIVIEDEKGKIINYSKQVVYMVDYLNIDFKKKEITSSMFKQIEKNIIFDAEIMKGIEYEVKMLGQSIYRFTEDIDLDILYNSEVSIMNLLKLFNFRIDDSELLKPMDRLLLLISIYADFNICEVIIFVNLKSFFSNNEIREIYKLLKYKKLKFLCLESELYDKISGENIYLIDEDLVEISYS